MPVLLIRLFALQQLLLQHHKPDPLWLEILESQGLKIIIHGGNNQILPNATHAIQNIYIGGEKVSSRQISAANGIIVTEDGNIINIPSAEQEQEPSDNLTDEQQRLSLYI